MANMVFDKQAAKMLGKRRRVRRWVPVVACLALVVMVGTFYFMIQEGQAMARKDMALDCALPVHEHSSACFDEEENLACGLANYVVHEHNDDCYDKEGTLVCALPEIREHHHVEACYEKREVLVCGQEQTVGHVHSNDCYEETLICPLEEAPAHAHGTACYDENHQLICGLEEGVGHAHGPDCYEKKLICGQEAGAGSHIHTDGCYETELILTCGKPEISLHTHTKECYSVLNDDGTLSKLESLPDGEEEEEEKVLVLTCGMLQTERHEHGNECFRRIEKEESVAESQPESTGEQESALESSSALSSALESSALESEDSGLESSSGLESGEDLPSSQPEEKPQPEEEPQDAYAYEDATLKVAAEGELPEGARLVVERLEDPQQLAQRQAKLKRAMEDEEYALHALLQVSLQDGNGEQVPFEGPVSLKTEFFGEGVSAEGGKVCAVAFEEAPEREDLETVPGMVLDMERAQQIPVTLAENGGAVIQIDGDTLLGFGSKAPVKINTDQVNDVEEEEGADANVLHVSQSFSYDTDSLFHVVFHVEGDATLPEEAQPESAEEPETSSQAEAPVKWGAEEDSQAEDSLHDTVVSAADGEESSADLPQAEEASSQPEEGEASQAEAAPQPTEAAPKVRLGGAILATGGTLPANSVLVMEQPVEFVVEKVQPGDPAYLPYADYVQAGEEEGQEDGTGISPLEVMSYRLCYAGMELDLSDCTVTAEVRATSELSEQIKSLTPEEVASEAEGDVGVIVSMLVPAGNGEEPAQEGVIYPNAEAVAAAKAEEDVKNAPRVVEDERFAADEDSDIEVLDSCEVTEDSEDVIISTVVHKQGVPMPTSLEEPKAANRAVSRNTIGLSTNTSVNPSYSVEYYAWLDRVDRGVSGDAANSLSVIDTSAASNGGKPKLPDNSTSQTLTNLQIETSADNYGKVKSTEMLTEIYKPKGKDPNDSKDVCTYFTKPNIKYVDALVDPETGKKSDAYTLKQIWVLKDSAKNLPEPQKSNKENWDIYGVECHDITPITDRLVTNCEEKLHFTNRREAAKKYNTGDVYIYIAHESVLRLVYEPTSALESYDGTFYDYDISSGKADDEVLKTMSNGINSYFKGNGAPFAFGNNNAGTNYGTKTWNGYELNKYNGKSYEGCTFGLVTDIKEGALQFATGIEAPDLFSTSEFTGKRVFEEGGLTFSRLGDTYTLTSVTVDGTNAATSKPLDKFSHPGKYDGINDEKKIWTNHFWPMDSFSNPQGDGLFGDPTKLRYHNTKGKWTTLPTSDNDVAHNSYFAMHSTIEFDLTSNYRGPLEYLFFGDDDMWVFLTGPNGTQLICDIGGVHRSVGEYVNLWDYIKKGESGEYKLDFYYTERGASGSTCWMQFTLPSVHGGTTKVEEGYTQLKIEKKVDGLKAGGSGSFDIKNLPYHDEEFIFTLKLTTKDGGMLPDDYAYTKYNANGPITDSDGILDREKVHSGSDFTLKNGEWIIINMLPEGTQYEITEKSDVVSVGLEASSNDSGKVTGYTIKTDSPKNDYLCSAYISRYNTETQKMVPGKPTPFDRGEKRTVSGSVVLNETGDKVQTVTYVNTVYAYELPKTGGGGVQVYIWAGAALLGAAMLGLVYKTTGKRGKEGEQKS